MRVTPVKLTAPEARHLLNLLFEDDEDEGYHGASTAYFLRADRLKGKMLAALKALRADP